MKTPDNRHEVQREWQTAAKLNHTYRFVPLTVTITNPWLPWLAKRDTFYLEEKLTAWCRWTASKHPEGKHTPLDWQMVSRVWTDNEKMLLRTLETMSWEGCTVCVLRASGCTVSLLRVLKLLGEEATEQNSHFYPQDVNLCQKTLVRSNKAPFIQNNLCQVVKNRWALSQTKILLLTY